MGRERAILSQNDKKKNSKKIVLSTLEPCTANLCFIASGRFSHSGSHIDDGICASESEAVLARDLVVSDLNKAGFVLDVSKSHPEPVQIIDWLGFTVDLKRGCFRVPQRKIDRLKLAVMNIPLSDTATACCSASIVGQIIPMSLAIGPISRLHTRALYSQRIFWSDRLFLSLEAQDELRF